MHYRHAMTAMDARVDVRLALSRSLRSLAALVESLDDAQYTTATDTGSSPIGAHIRHCVDHVDALLHALDGGELLYDRRERGTPIERNRTEAVSAIALRAASVESIPEDRLAEAIMVRALVAPEAVEREFPSNLAREALYVFHHTVHHTAIVAMIAAALGATVARDVGRAPSTVAADRHG